MRVVGVLDVDRPAVLERILDLRGDLRVGQIGQERELSLRDPVAVIGHHDGFSSLTFIQTLAVVVGTKSAVSVDS